MMMICAQWSMHRFMITTNAILLKLLPTKMTIRSATMMDTFGMTKN